MLISLLLFFVFVGELGLAAIVYLSESLIPEYALLTFFGVYFLQFLFSTVQGGVSDYSLRKESLIVAFNAVCLGQIFFLFAFENHYILIGAVALYGFLGNITPIARAALIDTELRSNFRLSIGLSTIAIGLGWIAMAYVAYYLQPMAGAILVTVLCFLCNFFVRFVKDPKDKSAVGSFSLRRSLQGEFYEIMALFKHRELIWGLLGYLVAEIAFYQIFARGKGQVYDPKVRFIIITWVLGYVIGAVLQHFVFRKSRERAGIFWGSVISIVAMLSLIFCTAYDVINAPLLAVSNALFALGFGFFIPCLFAIVSQKYKTHLQGKIYGLVDAVDGLALMVAVAINHLPVNFGISYLMTSSLILTGIALGFFFLTMRYSR